MFLLSAEKRTYVSAEKRSNSSAEKRKLCSRAISYWNYQFYVHTATFFAFLQALFDEWPRTEKIGLKLINSSFLGINSPISNPRALQLTILMDP
jgi:hypothetical protein